MRVVIEFGSFDRAEDFVETCIAQTELIGENGYDYTFEGYEYTKDGEIILDVRAREYDESDFGGFENDE